MVIIGVLSSYPWTYLPVFQLTIVSLFLLLFSAIVRDCYCVQSYCSLFPIVSELA